MVSDRYQRIYAAVRRIPRGRVATYGQIAELAGLDGHARQVGYALHALHGDAVPWHRVVNARGEVSPRSGSDSHELQRELLESEGVEFNVTGRIALDVYRWRTSGKRRTHANETDGGAPGLDSLRGMRRRKGGSGKGR